ncbi:hypothetical protein KXW62_000597 [Aspergillus fumigatus]|nr:hypothetical protein KXW62_000597 [Aspergillus fumigatus]
MYARFDQPSGHSGDTPRLRAACENCRQSKVKCNLSGKSTCIRCLRHGLPCRYRLANRSGKPKGSKNRATLKRLGQLPDEKPVLRALKGKYNPDTVMDNHSHTFHESPGSQGSDLTADASTSVFAYSSFQEPLPSADPVYMQASMSPTFLQKEFITKGLTSCPLAVHIPDAPQPPCACGGTVVFHMNQLKDMMANASHLRVDQMLQGIKLALSVCQGYLQCRNCPKDSTSLLLPISTIDFTLQLFEYWISYGLAAQHSVGVDSARIRYGDFELCSEESWWISRFLLRARLIQCKEVFTVLQEAIDVCLGSPSGHLGQGLYDENRGGSCLDQILRGSNTQVKWKYKTNMAARLAQVNAHLNYPAGLLAGKVAIITGSGQGIGAEAARLFANEGAKVIVADIDAEKATAVANAINAAGAGRALAVVGDILDDAYIKDLVSKAAEFGNGKIHILVNNAGFTWDGVIHKITDKQWDTMLAVHNTAPFKLIRAAAPYFRVKDGEDRVIINISSTSGIHGNAGQANYALAKAGLVGLTKTITKEWGPAYGVRANTIAFGFVKTRLTAAKEEGAFITTPDGTKVALGIPGKQLAGRKGDEKQAYPDIPLGRPASPEEAARAILGVCSPYFSYVSGETIRVTGGRNT